ncbi:Sec23/Sec24 trunk domain-containing protein [Radiomyces spectabilis]|uniref:Sec23/Sec24 trunk domain-containing protein n=1 Tax=Radiomyces spectabilis TaxID=64574 RepID=UPI00221EFBDD|nr:Sec23/Sec24 trunk domain-containing protein [Radiomyces spectabilis]KAI8369387.1 Sec23/Sec24 trunk domain-containing protein [Radiomyces spectabilis]
MQQPPPFRPMPRPPPGQQPHGMPVRPRPPFNGPAAARPPNQPLLAQPMSVNRPHQLPRPNVPASVPRPTLPSQPVPSANDRMTLNQATPSPEPTSPIQANSPGINTHASERHRRKRMYPEQIAKMYTEQASPHVPPAPLAAPGPVPALQSYGYPQPSPLAQPTQAAPSAYGQNPVDAVSAQLGNMRLGNATPNTQTVPLQGTRPVIGDLYGPPPPIRLPPNIAITDSPYANCDYSYKCCTVNAIPATDSLLRKSRMPLALVLTPYRTVKDLEMAVPVVTDSVISRCRMCRTYINPFVTFVEGGQRWKCNICFLLNDVPAAFDYDAVSQQQVDRWRRPELNYGCVEFVAPTEYMVRPPEAPAYVFIIDVSHAAIQSGMLTIATRTLLETLDRIPNAESRTRIAIITVDSALHFYNLDSKLSEPQMFVVSDMDEVFLPQPIDLLVNLRDSKSILENLLQKLPDMFKDTVNVNNALGPALQAAYEMLSATGGKIICLQNTLPNTGVGALKPREEVKLLGTAKESTMLNAASPFYKTIAVDCSRSQVGCDMLIFGSQYSDVATLSCVPHYTGGQTYYYPGFNANRSEDAMKFAHEFSELIAEQIGLEAVIRIRASRNLRMSAFHGNFFIRSSDLLALPNVPRDQQYCVEVAIEDDLKGPTVCFQTALLHTTCFGERRIRVITMCLPVTHSISELYASANQQAIAAYLGAKAVERALSSKLDDARDAIVNKTVDLLGVYKTHVLGSAPGSIPQLAAPDNLKLLPLLALALIKHDALRQSSQIPTDMRANAMNLLRTMPLQLLIPYLCGNLYSLHNMPPEAISDHGVILPPICNLTAEMLEPHGCYLLENGQNMFIFVARGVVPQLCLDLFDVRSYEGLRGGKFTMPALDNKPLNRKVNMIIGKLREMRRGNYYPTLYLVKEDGDPYLRLWFMSLLIEDRSDNIMSYQQFVQHVKDRVSDFKGENQHKDSRI